MIWKVSWAMERRIVSRLAAATHGDDGCILDGRLEDFHACLQRCRSDAFLPMAVAVRLEYSAWLPDHAGRSGLAMTADAAVQFV